MESYSWYKGHSYHAHHLKRIALKNKICRYHPYHGSTSSFSTDFWWWEGICFHHWIERLHFYFPLNFIAMEHQQLLQVSKTRLRNDLEKHDLNSQISKYFKHNLLYIRDMLHMDGPCWMLNICWKLHWNCSSGFASICKVFEHVLHSSYTNMAIGNNNSVLCIIDLCRNIWWVCISDGPKKVIIAKSSYFLIRYRYKSNKKGAF